MPLDREITITYEARGAYDEHGNYVDGVKALLPVWAGRQDKSLIQVIEVGGKRGEYQRTYRIRWLDVLQFAQADQLTVNDGTRDTDGNIVKWYVLNLTEETGRNMDQRRRWMDIEIGSST